MKSVELTRREFMVGCSAGIAAMAGARITQLAFAKPSHSPDLAPDILVTVFLRGGWDALNVVPPIAGADRGYYEAARQEIKVPVTGTGAALPLNAQFGFHPAMAPLYDLYQANRVAVVHAAGLTSDTRSHFDAQQFMELGTPDNSHTGTGWITRHMETAPNLPPSILFPALSAGSEQAMSLLGSREAVAMSSPSSFDLSGHWNYETLQRSALRKLYDGDTWLYQNGTQTLNAIDIIESADPGDYIPANGADYPSSSFGRHMQTIAQMIKMNIGLQVATVDLGGWDTHEYQGDDGGGYFADKLEDLSESLRAFYQDLDSGYNNRMTLVLMSEFGRRLVENFNHGTDHGHGGVMLLMGGNVFGGKVYGNWPGLHNAQLYDNADLAVTTDYRNVLCEILEKRLDNPNLDQVFPEYTNYSSMGIVRGNVELTEHIHIPMISK